MITEHSARMQRHVPTMRHSAGKAAMFGSFVVEMVVGLLATFALLGLCVTTLTEVVQTYIRSIRANNLEQCLRQLFTCGEEGQAQFFYGQVRTHPLIQSLSASGQSPSYLPIPLIADALIDELINATVATPQADRLLEKLELGIAAISSTPLGRVLTLFLSKSQSLAPTPEQALKLFKSYIEQWMEAGMERAEGWTRRQPKTVSLIVAGILCKPSTSMPSTSRMRWPPTLRCVGTSMSRRSKTRSSMPRPSPISAKRGRNGCAAATTRYVKSSPAPCRSAGSAPCVLLGPVLSPGCAVVRLLAGRGGACGLGRLHGRRLLVQAPVIDHSTDRATSRNGNDPSNK